MDAAEDPEEMGALRDFCDELLGLGRANRGMGSLTAAELAPCRKKEISVLKRFSTEKKKRTLEAGSKTIHRNSEHNTSSLPHSLCQLGRRIARVQAHRVVG